MVKIRFRDDVYVFRVGTKESDYIGYSGGVIWISFKGGHFAEDVIEICGAVRGVKKYTTVLRNPVILPGIDAAEVTLITTSGST